jgi:hypothetical protein
MTPPHSEIDEKAILGCVLLSPDCLAEAQQSGSTARSFHIVSNRVIFLAFEAMQNAGVSIEFSTLISWLQKTGKLAEAGGASYVSALTEATPSAVNLQYHIDAVREAQQKREFLQLCADGPKIIATGADWRTVSEDLRTRFDSIAIDGLPLGNADAVINSRRFDQAIEPPIERAIYTLKGIDIATPGNLLSINGLVKNGKSAVVEAMQAAVMTSRPDADCFGFKGFNPNGLALLSFDTEQSHADHWRHVKRTLKRAGLDAPPPWFESFFFAGLDLRQLLECTEKTIYLARKTHGGIHSIFLDGVGDYLSDVNNPAESNALVAKLHGRAIELDCVIVAAIHFNPGSDGKSRGHLGSQLERKAETNLRLDKADGVTEIWSDKNRKAPIPKGNGPCFAWSDEAEMHVSVESRLAAADSERRESLAMLADDIFRERPAMHYADLIEFFTVKCRPKLKQRTAERRVNELSRLGLIEKSVAGLYTPKT